MLPGISIIVPAYKRLEQTIGTVQLLQAAKGWDVDFHGEIIVADCTPGPSLRRAIHKHFGQTVRYTRPKNPGIATNKNQGARIAKFPILIFCDSDMEIEPAALQRTVQYLRTHPMAAAVGGTVLWKGGKKDGNFDRPRKEDRCWKSGNTTFVEALYSRYLATYATVFWKVGGYDERVFNMRGEGSDLSIRYWRGGFPLTYSSNIVVHHVHDAPDSIALRIQHPEQAIAKDLVLLAYKYDISGDEWKNFIHTVGANFVPLGELGFYEFLQGVTQHYDLLVRSKPILDRFKAQDRPHYNFKFLEIFSQAKLAKDCVVTSKKRLQVVRKSIFT